MYLKILFKSNYILSFVAVKKFSITKGGIMRNIVKASLFYCLSLANYAIASSGEGGETGLPWEKPIQILQQSLFYLGGLFVLIGLLWAGYNFLIQQEKEAGFKKIIGTFIGGAIIFGAKGIVSTLYGASF